MRLFSIPKILPNTLKHLKLFSHSDVHFVPLSPLTISSITIQSALKNTIKRVVGIVSHLVVAWAVKVVSMPSLGMGDVYTLNAHIYCFYITICLNFCANITRYLLCVIWSSRISNVDRDRPAFMPQDSVILSFLL